MASCLSQSSSLAPDVPSYSCRSVARGSLRAKRDCWASAAAAAACAMLRCGCGGEAVGDACGDANGDACGDACSLRICSCCLRIISCSFSIVCCGVSCCDSSSPDCCVSVGVSVFLVREGFVLPFGAGGASTCAASLCCPSAAAIRLLFSVWDRKARVEGVDIARWSNSGEAGGSVERMGQATRCERERLPVCLGECVEEHSSRNQM
jgi:hypothetical protein